MRRINLKSLELLTESTIRKFLEQEVYWCNPGVPRLSVNKWPQSNNKHSKTFNSKENNTKNIMIKCKIKQQKNIKGQSTKKQHKRQNTEKNHGTKYLYPLYVWLLQVEISLP